MHEKGGKFDIQSYEIKQSPEIGSISVTFVADVPDGDCKAYAEFLNQLSNFIEDSNFSIKP